MQTDSTMSLEGKKLPVNVIALDFYDGATEGYLNSFKSNGPIYFKLVAWDENQDKRLFVSIPLFKTEFDELVSVFTTSESTPTSSVWIPEPKSLNNENSNTANQILKTIHKRFDTTGFLILGLDVTDSMAKTHEIDTEARKLISKHLTSGKPEILDCWIKFIEKKPGE